MLYACLHVIRELVSIWIAESPGTFSQYTAESTNTVPGGVGRSFVLETTSVSIQSMAELNITIEDDDIALEDPEEVVLQLTAPVQSCSKISLTPLKSTRIFVYDNDRECNVITWQCE